MKNLMKQLSRFVIIGLCATGADFLVYTLSHPYLTTALAKALSFITGTCVAFLGNKQFTFSSAPHTRSGLYKFFFLYLCSLWVNVGVNELCLYSVPSPKWIGFVIATATSMVINFLGQKFWVFKEKTL